MKDKKDRLTKKCNRGDKKIFHEFSRAEEKVGGKNKEYENYITQSDTLLEFFPCFSFTFNNKVFKIKLRIIVSLRFAVVYQKKVNLIYTSM